MLKSVRILQITHFKLTLKTKDYTGLQKKYLRVVEVNFKVDTIL